MNSTWQRLTRWPERPERFLGLPDHTTPLVCDLFTVKRWRIERLAAGQGDVEMRVLCRIGELYPVNQNRWGWCGPGGTWSLRLIRMLKTDAHPPLSDRVLVEASIGTRYDECQIHFPVERLMEVARIVNVRIRRRGNPAGNPETLKKPNIGASGVSRINSDAAGVVVVAPLGNE